MLPVYAGKAINPVGGIDPTAREAWRLAKTVLVCQNQIWVVAVAGGKAGGLRADNDAALVAERSGIKAEGPV